MLSETSLNYFQACVVAQQNENFAHIAAWVRGIMFLSTPHRGSSYAATLNNILVLAGIPRKLYVSELHTMSPSIQDLNVSFISVCEYLQIVSLYETLPTRIGLGKKKVVSCLS